MGRVRRVTRLTLRDIGPFASLDLDLDADLVLIYAANGAGKTTVARSLGPVLAPGTIVPTPRRGDPDLLTSTVTARILDGQAQHATPIEWAPDGQDEARIARESPSSERRSAADVRLATAAARLTLLGQAFFDKPSLFVGGRPHTIEGLVARIAVRRGDFATEWLAPGSERMVDLRRAITDRKDTLEKDDKLEAGAEELKTRYVAAREQLATAIAAVNPADGVGERVLAALASLAASWPRVSGLMDVTKTSSVRAVQRVRDVVRDERARLVRMEGGQSLTNEARKLLTEMLAELREIEPGLPSAMGLRDWLRPDGKPLLAALETLVDFVRAPVPGLASLPPEAADDAALVGRERALIDAAELRSLIMAVERGAAWADALIARHDALRSRVDELRTQIANAALDAVDEQLAELVRVAANADSFTEGMAATLAAQATGADRAEESRAIKRLELALARLQTTDVTLARRVLESATAVLKDLVRTHADALTGLVGEHHGFRLAKSERGGYSAGDVRDEELATAELEDEIGRTPADLSDSEAAQLDTLWALANRLAVRASQHADMLPEVLVLDDHGNSHDLRSTSRDVLLLRRLAYARAAVLEEVSDKDTSGQPPTQQPFGERRELVRRYLEPEQVIVLTHDRDLYELLLDQLTPPHGRTMRVIELPRIDGYARAPKPKQFAAVPAPDRMQQGRRERLGAALSRVLTWGRELPQEVR